jgi:hypothetical protein
VLSHHFKIGLLSICLICVSCGVAPQPRSAETVAALEVPLPTESDRLEFLKLLDKEARAEGLHVDSAGKEELQRLAADIPQTAMTIHAAIWRGPNDDKSEAVIMDQKDHLGQVWLSFSRGENERLAARFRNKAMRVAKARWPETLTLPIMPTGAIPLHEDLIKTSDGYKVDPAAASKYEIEGNESKRVPKAP